VAGNSGGRSSAQAPGDRLQRVVQPYVDAQMFMGSVLVAENGKIIFSKSYGMADRVYQMR
jgi:CubicO group peptidase (beta-lactamase class C family)